MNGRFHIFKDVLTRHVLCDSITYLDGLPFGSLEAIKWSHESGDFRVLKSEKSGKIQENPTLGIIKQINPTHHFCKAWASSHNFFSCVFFSKNGKSVVWVPVVWIPRDALMKSSERDCYLTIPRFESQTTGPQTNNLPLADCQKCLSSNPTWRWWTLNSGGWESWVAVWPLRKNFRRRFPLGPLVRWTCRKRR